MRTKLLVGAIAAAMTGLIAPAHAGLLVDGITFDLRGLDGLANDNNYLIQAVDEVTFNARAQSITNDTDANGLPTPGETFSVFGSGVATTFSNEDTGVIAKPLLNLDGSIGGLDGFEVTFRFRADGEFTDLDANDANFAHTECLDANQCLLEFYVERLDGAGSGQKFALNDAHDTADGGVKFATFELLPGAGGNFDFTVGDGVDDANFRLVSAIAGTLIDTNTGQDLSMVLGAGGDPVLIALTDSNFDTGGGFGNRSCPDGSFFGGNLGEPVGGQSATNFCVNEDGSQTYIPEPGTLALLGGALLLLGAGVMRRRVQA